MGKESAWRLVAPSQSIPHSQRRHTHAVAALSLELFVTEGTKRTIRHMRVSYRHERLRVAVGSDVAAHFSDVHLHLHSLSQGPRRPLSTAAEQGTCQWENFRQTIHGHMTSNHQSIWCLRSRLHDIRPGWLSLPETRCVLGFGVGARPCVGASWRFEQETL